MRPLLLLFLLGCAKDVTSDVDGLADRACACADKKDATCGKAVLVDLVALAEHRNVKADKAKAAASARRLGECLIKSGVKSMEISQAITPPKSAEPAQVPAERN